MFWLAVAILCLSGALAAAYRAGREMGRAEVPQLQVTARELMAARRRTLDRLDRARDVVSEVRHDARTHPHTALQLDRALEALDPSGEA